METSDISFVSVILLSKHYNLLFTFALNKTPLHSLWSMAAACEFLMPYILRSCQPYQANFFRDHFPPYSLHSGIYYLFPLSFIMCPFNMFLPSYCILEGMSLVIFPASPHLSLFYISLLLLCDNKSFL